MQTVAQDPKSKEKKVIKFSLSQQTVEAFEDSTKVFKFDCVTGDRDHPTDRGFFKVIRKPHFQYRSGAYNVQMNYLLFFTPDAKAIYEWASVGTTVQVL